MEMKNLNRLHQVTPVSKYLAGIIFILMPFLGGYVGYNLASEKTVRIEAVTVKDTTNTIDRVAMTAARATIINGNVEVVFSDGSKKIVAKAIDAEDVPDIHSIETFLRTYISPDGRYVALQAVGFEDSFISVYNVAEDRLEEKIYGEVTRWTDGGKLEVNACNLAGEECTRYISATAESPWIMDGVQ